MPWGKERVQLFFGEVPLGESLEPIVVRKGFVRQLLPGAKVGAQGTRAVLRSLHRPEAAGPRTKKVRRRLAEEVEPHRADTYNSSPDLKSEAHGARWSS